MLPADTNGYSHSPTCLTEPSEGAGSECVDKSTLADRCGFARSYMSRIERGKANPSLDAIETLADGLKVPVVKLFDE